MSDYLQLPPPLEVDLPQPRLSWDPVHVGLAECVETGYLRSPLPFCFSAPAQAKLEELRARLNENIQSERRVSVWTPIILVGLPSLVHTSTALSSLEAHDDGSIFIYPSKLCIGMR